VSSDAKTAGEIVGVTASDAIRLYDQAMLDLKTQLDIKM